MRKYCMSMAAIEPIRITVSFVVVSEKGHILFMFSCLITFIFYSQSVE